MMVTRHMKEFGTTVEQLAYVSVKNHRNALYNPYSQKHERLTVADVRAAPMVAWPLTRLDICVMSDGAAAVILASEEGMAKLEKAAGARLPRVKVAGIGRGTDAMRMADRPHQSYDDFLSTTCCPTKTPKRRAPTTRGCGTTASATPASTRSGPGAWQAKPPTPAPALKTRCRR